MSNKRPSMTMDCWNKDWIVHGHKLVCRSCGAGQFPGGEERPFRHSAACAISGSGARYPWRELNDILTEGVTESRRLVH